MIGIRIILAAFSFLVLHSVRAEVVCRNRVDGRRVCEKESPPWVHMVILLAILAAILILFGILIIVKRAHARRVFNATTATTAGSFLTGNGSTTTASSRGGSTRSSHRSSLVPPLGNGGASGVMGYNPGAKEQPAVLASHYDPNGPPTYQVAPMYPFAAAAAAAASAGIPPGIAVMQPPAPAMMFAPGNLAPQDVPKETV